MLRKHAQVYVTHARHCSCHSNGVTCSSFLLLWPEVAQAMVQKLHAKGLMDKALLTLGDHPPLQIEDEPLPVAGSAAGKAKPEPPKKKQRLITTFKEVWRVANADKSLAETSMYEAAGNSTWANCLPDKSPTVAQAGTYRQLKDCLSLYDPMPNIGRVVFPFTIQTYVDTPTAFKGKYPKALCLMSGHLALAAWWFCAYEAVEADDHERLKQLWQCALTATIRVHVVRDQKELAFFCLKAAEDVRVLEKAASDNLVGFADKVKMIHQQLNTTLPKVVEILNNEKVMYKGGKMTKTFLAACLAISSNLNDAARQTLLYLESKYGREVLTSGYTKLYRLMTTISKAAKGPFSTDQQNTVSDVLDLLALVLDFKLLTPQDVSEDFLTGKEGTSKKPAKDNADRAPWVSAVLHLLHLVWHAHTTVTALDKEKPEGMDDALEFYARPGTYRKHLQKVMQQESSLFWVMFIFV